MGKKVDPKEPSPSGGRKPLLAFRVDPKVIDLLAEIRTLEPLADPGLLPRGTRSDSEMAKWIFLEGAQKTKNRLVGIVRVNRLKFEIESLNKRLKIRKERFNEEVITPQEFEDEKFEIENKINSLEYEIKETRIQAGLPNDDGVIETGKNEFEEAFYFNDKKCPESIKDLYYIINLFRERSDQRREFYVEAYGPSRPIPTAIKNTVREIAKKYNADFSSVSGIKEFITEMESRPEMIEFKFKQVTRDSSDFNNILLEGIKKETECLDRLTKDDLIQS